MDPENRGEKDLTVTLHHIMDFGPEPYEIEILNVNEIVRSRREYAKIAVDCV